MLLSISLSVLLALPALANPLAQPLPTDPATGGITPCATVKCARETECKVIDGRARCVPREPEQCGSVLCPLDTFCCNASCNACAPIGGACTQQVCTEEPEEVPCGKNTCVGGDYCCNDSCGYCRAPGESCTEEFCLPEPEEVPCGDAICTGGLVCCNESCGICAPPDGACIDLWCGLAEGEAAS